VRGVRRPRDLWVKETRVNSGALWEGGLEGWEERSGGGAAAGEAGWGYGGRPEKGAHGSQVPAILFRRRRRRFDEVLPPLVVQRRSGLRLR